MNDENPDDVDDNQNPDDDHDNQNPDDVHDDQPVVIDDVHENDDDMSDFEVPYCP